jgi:hypothetical protein
VAVEAFALVVVAGAAPAAVAALAAVTFGVVDAPVASLISPAI